MKNDLFLPELVRRCPELDRVIASRLAQVWSLLLDRIIKRMLDICEDEIGLTLHIDQRPNAAFELAGLMLFLTGGILDAKAKVKPLREYDPDSEAALLETKEEQIKISNTARNAAEGAWKPFMAKWRKERPLVETTGQSGPPPKLRKPIKPSFRENMHYVPQFTTRHWASKKSGKFLVYTIGIDGGVRAEPSTAKLWGVARSLYTQGLEHHLGLMEGDARRPYQKLAAIVPLNEIEKRRWIAFLIAQLIRTPRFMRKMLHEQKAWIERTGFNYPTSPAHLGRGFEAMFTHDDLFAKFYRLLTRHTWEVVRAADGLTFLKGDNPAVIHGSTAKRTWQLMYPLTPVRCFIAGPALENGPARIVPHQRKLTDAQTLAVNGATCSFAENSVIGVVTANRIDPKPTIRANLPKTRTLDTVELPLWGLDTG